MSNTLVNLVVRGLTVVGGFKIPAGCIPKEAIEDGANIETSKLVHRHSINYSQAGGSSVASATVPIFIARGTSGTIVGVEAAILTAAASGATVDVDLQLGDASNAFSSVLSAAIAITDATTVRTPVAGTLSGTSFDDGDVLQVVVTATAGGGTLPQGLIVTVTLDETPA